MANIPSLAEHLRRQTKGEVRLDEPLAPYTTWRIGGPADLLFRPLDNTECRIALELASDSQIPVTFLGAGSNVLIADKGIRGLVVQTKNIREIVWDGSLVKVGAGLPLSLLSQLSVEKSFSGLEFAAGIPGSVGGAVLMNAGAYGSCIGDLVLTVKTFTKEGQEKTYSQHDLEFSYRNSILKHAQELVTEVVFSLKPGTAKAGKEIMEEYLRLRKSKHPLHLPNAGSVFKNPPGTPAARLIEAAGAKGWRVGGAQVAMEHANFIVNLGQAKACDVVELIEEVQKAVEEHFSICLETEVLFLGFDGSRR